MHIESWKGHKINMKCAVKKAFTNSTVQFFWHRPSGQPLTGREVYFKDRELSQMTVVTDTDAQFNPVRCTAKKEMSTQTLDIIIKLLREWLYLAVPLPQLSPPFQKKRPSGLKNITFFEFYYLAFFPLLCACLGLPQRRSNSSD